MGAMNKGGGSSSPTWDRDAIYRANTANVDQALADGHTFLPGMSTANVAGYGQGGPEPQVQQQQQAQAAPAQAQNQYYGGNMFGLNNQAIQDAIAKWQAQNGTPQTPAVEEPPPVVAEPPPPQAATGGFEPGSILANLYGSNVSQSERLTNGLNYAQPPTYAPLPQSSGDFEGQAQDGLFVMPTRG
jgi:hypothetical protein